MKYNRGGLLLIAIAALGLTGCGDTFGTLDFTFRSVPPASVNVAIDYDAIKIPVGIGVGVIARPYTDDGKEMDDNTDVELESKNPGILIVGPSQPNQYETEDKDKENWTFVIVGAAAGTTEVAVRIEGSLAGHIPATVEEQ